MVLVITYRSAETITNTRAHEYRWRELPRVRFLSRQTFGRDKHIFVATNMCLSRQKTCLSRQDFVVTRIVLVAAPANDIGRVNRNKSNSSTGVCVCAKWSKRYIFTKETNIHLQTTDYPVSCRLLSIIVFQL